MNTMPKLLTIQEAVTELQLSEDNIIAMIKDGRLPGFFVEKKSG